VNSVRDYAVDIAQHAADHGAQASLYASDEWATHAQAILEELIEIGVRFTAEDILSVLEPARSPGAMGAVIRRAARAGRSRCVDYRPASRVRARGRILRVWVAA